MTAIIYLIAALAFTQPGASVAGVVVDAQGAAVPGAVVRLYARGRAAQLTTTTDAAGAYRFARLAPGDYLLDAEAPGFARAAAGEARVEAGAETKLDLTLQPAGVRSEIVITAAGTPQAVDEVSKAVTVVEQAEIDARDEFYLAEALRTVPGLRVRQLGGPGAQTTIRTRGLRNQDTAVLLDGMRIRDAAAPQGDAVSLIGSLAVTDISRVEVVRGSGSSLYGTNAIGGVVNLVTDEGGGTPRGSVLLEGGSLGLFRGRAQVAGGAAGERIAYSAGLSHFNVTRGVDGDDASRNTSFQGRVLFRLTPRRRSPRASTRPTPSSSSTRARTSSARCPRPASSLPSRSPPRSCAATRRGRRARSSTSATRPSSRRSTTRTVRRRRASSPGR